MGIITDISKLPALRQARLRRGKQSLGKPLVIDNEADPEGPTIQLLAHLERPWYMVPARVRLHTLLFSGAIMVYATSGYGGSMMNSLQTVTYWDDYFTPEARFLEVFPL
ncbi:hypothetical protein V1517DRAFT_340431 [Lipomyces orientalis]|uniref:Uncharacterized protein n=1 Tax=Lipomyces orientalis TaxID=1233043 RepID=A0ACC3THW5_9ASCO